MDGDGVRHESRTAEEIAWDREFSDDRPSTSDLAGDLAGLVRFAARLPGALVQASMNMVPDETVRHARAAVRESFLAVRSLLGAVGDRIEEMLAEPDSARTDQATVQGPPGTWGTGRAASARPLSSDKVKRIDVADDAGDQPSL